MLHSVLLVESESETIRDVSASLRLVSIPITVVHSVEEARTALGVARPTVILTRLELEQERGLAQKLVALLQSDPALSSIPLALIATPAERSAAAASSSLFKAILPLPVEFPSFTHRVQELLDAVSVSATPSAPTAAVRTDTPRSAPREVKTLGRVGASYDRRLLVALALQQEVFDRLRRDDHFGQLAAADIPARIEQLTSEICRSYDVNKIFG